MLIKEGNCVVVNSIHYLYLYMDNANQPLQTDDLGLIEGVVRQENGASDGFVRRYGDLIYSTCSSIFDETMSRNERDHRIQADFALTRTVPGIA